MHVLIKDGAGFHLLDGHPDLPDNVRVVSLPPYSPQLNPWEGLWDQVKDELCNRVFATVAEQRTVLGGTAPSLRHEPGPCSHSDSRLVTG